MLKPLGDRVIIRPSAEEEKTKGGIFLPDTARDKPTEGEVLAVGPGRRLKDGRFAPLGVKVGDRVIHSKYAGTEIKDGKDELVIVDADSVLAIID